MNARLDVRQIDNVNDSREGHQLQYQQQQQTLRPTSSSDRSNELEIDQFRLNDGYHNQHERLRPCKSLDSRITLNPNVRSGTQYLSNSDGSRKLGGRLSLDTPSGQLKRPQNGGGTRLATLAAEQDARFISTPPPNMSTEDMSEDGERRAMSARERPQSAWKNRKSGRQPKFTFTDFADSSNDPSADVSTSGGRSHRNNSSPRKQEDERDAATASSPVDPDAVHTYHRAPSTVTSELRHQSRPSAARRQQLRLQRSDEELSVDFSGDRNEESISPLPNDVIGSTFDSQRRRHSLYAQLPTKAAAAHSLRPAAASGSNDVTCSPNRRRGSFNDDADSSSIGSEDSGDNNGGMCTNKEDGVGFRFRNGSLNDCEREARRRVLARLAGSESHASVDTDYDVIAATKAAAEHVNNGGGLPVRRRLSQAAAVSGRTLPPRKLEPLFPTDISGRQN